MKNIILLFCTILFYYSCGSGNIENYKVAYLRNNQGKFFTVIVKGKRFVHPAGPFEIGKTYEDSAIFKIPRDEGTIKASELGYDTGSFKSNGSILIKNNKLKIVLYYQDTLHKIGDSCSWNGEYNLIRIK